MTDDVAAAPEAAPVETTTPETPSEPVKFENNPQVDTDLRAVWDKLHPHRAENGQFASKEPQAPEPATADEGEPADQPVETTEGEQETTPAIDPPLSWSAEQKAVWATLPPGTQQYIAARDKETHEAITRQGQVIKSYEPLTKTLEDFRDVYESYNLAPDQALAYLFSAERQLRTNPVAAMKELCTAYRVDPVDLIGEQQPQQGQQRANDPRVDQLMSELHQIRSTLSARDQQAKQAEMETYNREIAEFAKDKPHFEALRADMAKVLSAGIANDLAGAYEAACKLNPTISAQIQAAAQKAEAEKKAKEAEAKTKEAKRAASVNLKGSPGHGNTPKTMDDTLKEIANRLYAT